MSSRRRAISRWTSVAALLSAVAPALATDWYVSPTGTSTNSGSLASPWSLTSALAATGNSAGKVKAGDTVWVLGGTYKYATRTNANGGNDIHGYSINNLNGTSASRITIRNYQGQQAIIDGGLSIAGGANVSHLNVWGLEVLVSENLTRTRTSTQAGSAVTDLARPAGGLEIHGGSDLHFINNIVHDNTYNGIGFWQDTQGGSELYGNTIYNNGWIGTDRNHGHGIYTQNGQLPDNSLTWDGTTKYITNNIVQNNYAKPMQVYSSGGAPCNNYNISKNIFQAWASTDDSTTLLGGSGFVAHDFTLTNNRFYYGQVELGYTGGMNQATLTNTTLSRGSIVNGPGPVTNVTQTGTVDAGYTGTPSISHPLLQTKIFIEPNTYEPDRADLLILQPNATTASQLVDFSSFVPLNANYALRDPEDFFGTPVLTGKYLGGSVSVPTGAEYNSFILQVVPEPSSIALLGGPLLLLKRWRRR